MTTHEVVETDCDLVVVGGGMAGLTAAARAAERGARVMVIEKGPRTGGSAAVSGGYLWTLDSAEAFRHFAPAGDPALQAVLLEVFPDAVEWARSRRIEMSGPFDVLDGRGYLLDIVGYLGGCLRAIESRGGSVAVDTRVQQLVLGDDGAVTGVELVSDGMRARVHAPWTLLATGSFQGDPQLLERYVDPAASHMPLRANPYSTGDGLKLALAAGASYGEENHSFYGHLVCSPVSLDDPSRFRTLGLYHSEHSLLLDEHGLRFVDESHGDHISNEAVFRHAGRRALLVWDERINREVVLKPWPAGSPGEDKMQIVQDAGGLCGVAKSLEEIGTYAGEWGFDGGRVRFTVEEYNQRVVSAPESLAPGRVRSALPLDEPPYYAVVVQPAITFPYGGIRADDGARVLDADGVSVEGLLVAGIDIGNVFHGGYGGGLALAATFALRAVETAGFSS